MKRTCSSPGCKKFAQAKGLCDTHYRYQKRHTSEYKTYYNSYQKHYRETQKSKDYCHSYRRTPEARIRSYIHHAKDKNLVFELDLSVFTELTSRSCTYCGGFTPNEKYVGIDRVDSSIGYIKSNCVPCCGICNKMKLDLSLDNFYLHIKRIYELHLDPLHNSGS